MKCYDEGILQAYLDKEVMEQIKLEIREHLRSCPLCSDKLARIQEQKKLLDSLLQHIDPHQVPVPDFKMKRARIRMTIRIAGVAAAIIFVMVIVYTSEIRQAGNQDMEIPAAEILIQEYLDWEDPNYLWQNKIQIYPFEEKGEIIIPDSLEKK
ncbi:MAG: hypothetical protein JSV24_00615 [Bacteroidales bacterium]|nr:MAG: hypothetical protein JSV24_00615 [Bacteroidales bacterium]